jgi:hypothetical protein
MIIVFIQIRSLNYTNYAVRYIDSWRKQQPNNRDDLDFTVTGVAGRVYYTEGKHASDFIFVP